MMKIKNVLITTAGFACCAVTSSAAISITQDFDSFTAGNLSGQGAWTGPTGPQVDTFDPGFGMSGNVVSYAGVDNQPVFTLGATFDDTNLLTVEFDLRISGDSSYTYLTLGSSLVSVGVERGNLTLRGASAGTQSFDHNLFTGANQYHMTLTIDPTAFAGAGSAEISFAQYTAETTLGASTTAFTNIELQLDDAGKALSDNTTAVLRMHNAGSTARVDNIAFTQVPEPSSTALLGLGGLAFILRRRK